jgi:hypothetical protein
LTFQNIRMVESKSATLPKEVVPKKPVQKGQQSPKDIEETSILYRVKHGL